MNPARSAERSEPVRIGVVGCGNVLEAGYMPLIERLRARGLAEIVMACDRRAQLRESVTERYRVPRFTVDYQELVEAPDVELVLVLTSMPLHALVSRTALQAGKHVLVEKPLATTLEEGLELVEIARRGPGSLLPAPHVILSPTFQTMARRIRRGDIGKPLLARARYGWTGPSWGKWFYQKGGGALFDLGVYNLTSLTGLLGPARRVTAMAGVAIPQRIVDGEPIQVEAEDNAHVLLDFGEAVFGVMTTGFTMQQYRSPCIEVYGSSGTIQMLGDDWDPEGYELWQNEVGAWQVYAETDPSWPWASGLEHLVECVRQGTRPLITPEHACHVLEIMLMAQESARDGQAHRLETGFEPPVFAEPAPGRPAYLVSDRGYRQ
jgi:predicted dehydrogenase